MAKKKAPKKAAKRKANLPTKRPPGHPPKLTDDVRNRILGMIAAGRSIRWAAAKAKVDHSAIIHLAKRDPEFAAQLEEANADCYGTLVGDVLAAGPADWRAAAWMLERKFPDEFGKKTEVTHDGKVEIAVKFVDDFFTRNARDFVEDGDDIIEAEFKTREDEPE